MCFTKTLSKLYLFFEKWSSKETCKLTNGVNLGLAETAAGVVKDVVAELAGFVEVDHMGDEEVEHVVTSLTRRLVGHPGLLQQVGLNVSSSHAPHVVEPHTDELSKP